MHSTPPAAPHPIPVGQDADLTLLAEGRARGLANLCFPPPTDLTAP